MPASYPQRRHYYETGTGAVAVRFLPSEGSGANGSPAAREPGRDFLVTEIRLHITMVTTPSSPSSPSGPSTPSDGAPTPAPTALQVWVDSYKAIAHDCELDSMVINGTDYVWPRQVCPGPSAGWAFHRSDAIRLTWTNPTSLTWGLELIYMI